MPSRNSNVYKSDMDELYEDSDDADSEFEDDGTEDASNSNDNIRLPLKGSRDVIWKNDSDDSDWEGESDYFSLRLNLK